MNLAVGTVGGKLFVSAAIDLPPKISGPSRAEIQRTPYAPAMQFGLELVRVRHFTQRKGAERLNACLRLSK